MITVSTPVTSQEAPPCPLLHDMIGAKRCHSVQRVDIANTHIPQDSGHRIPKFLADAPQKV
jgi:hypothetical protein